MKITRSHASNNNISVLLRLFCAARAAVRQRIAATFIISFCIHTRRVLIVAHAQTPSYTRYYVSCVCLACSVVQHVQLIRITIRFSQFPSIVRALNAKALHLRYSHRALDKQYRSLRSEPNGTGGSYQIK